MSPILTKSMRSAQRFADELEKAIQQAIDGKMRLIDLKKMYPGVSSSVLQRRVLEGKKQVEKMKPSRPPILDEVAVSELTLEFQKEQAGGRATTSKKFRGNFEVQVRKTLRVGITSTHLGVIYPINKLLLMTIFVILPIGCCCTLLFKVAVFR